MNDTQNRQQNASAAAEDAQISTLLKPGKYAGKDESQHSYSKGAYDQWLDDKVHLDALEHQRDELLAAVKSAHAALSQPVFFGDHSGNRIAICMGGDTGFARNELKIAIAKAEGGGQLMRYSIHRQNRTQIREAAP